MLRWKGMNKMKKLGITCLLLALLCGCQSQPKEPLTKQCMVRQNDMDVVFHAISKDHEKVTNFEAEMYMSEGAMVNYGFGSFETAKNNMEYINDYLNSQESDGYELELVYDGNFYIMKMKVDLKALSDEMKARLSIDIESETFDWNTFSDAVFGAGGSCQ